MSATPANVHLGTGRRKTSTARVRITEGSGKLTVNGRTFDDYFSHDNFAKQAYAPLLRVQRVVNFSPRASHAARISGRNSCRW